MNPQVHVTPPKRAGSFVEAVIAFARVLRHYGFRVSVPAVMTALQGISLVGVERLDDVKAVLRAAFLTGAEEIVLFERLFADFWLAADANDPQNPEPEASDDKSHNASSPNAGTILAEAGLAAPQEADALVSSVRVMYSPQESLKTQDFKDISAIDDPRMTRLIREMLAPLIRRMATAHRSALSGSDLDFRKLLRKSIQHGGEFLQFPKMRPRRRVRRLVFLCDVSGSMNPYLRFMLRFIKELQALPTKVETFVFATRLNRITPILRALPFNRALEEIGKTVRDWSGGTRIGESLGEFVTSHGQRLLGPRTLVLIFSDGWDRGDPALLEREMLRIHRQSYRVLWLNPLLGSPGYEPTCRGMKAALPHLDSFLPAHNLMALERLTGTLRGLLT